jgi:hypothetical protein
MVASLIREYEREKPNLSHMCDIEFVPEYDTKSMHSSIILLSSPFMYFVKKSRVHVQRLRALVKTKTFSPCRHGGAPGD